MIEPITAREINEQLQQLLFDVTIAINSAESVNARDELKTVSARLLDAYSASVNATVCEQIGDDI